MIFCIIDDHLLITRYVKKQLTSEYPDAIIRTYSNVSEMLSESFSEDELTVIICDIILAGENGLEMLIANKAHFKGAKMLVLSSLVDAALVRMALQNGIDGYLTKDCSEEELSDAIKTVIAGGRYVNHSLKEKLVKEVFIDEPVDYHLSAREKEVLHKICAGMTPKEIAHELQISVHTVQQYIKNLMGKFKIKRTTELVVFAIKRRLYNPDLD